jgi:UDP-N-acetylmuramate--alanine ligase
LSKADHIILSEIYPAREEPISGVSSELILAEAKNQGYNNFNYIPKIEDIDSYLLTHLQSGDMVITMGAGDIWHCGENLLKELKEQTIGN